MKARTDHTELLHKRKVMNRMVKVLGGVVKEGGGRGSHGMGSVVYLLMMTKGVEWVERLTDEIEKKGEFEFPGYFRWGLSRKKLLPKYKARCSKKSKARAERNREELSDSYICGLILHTYTGMARSDIPQELIELKREKVRLDRKLKEEFGKEFR